MPDKLERNDLLVSFEHTSEENDLILKTQIPPLELMRIELKVPCKLSVEEVIYRLCFELEEHNSDITPPSANRVKRRLDSTEKALLKHYLMTSHQVKKELTSFLKVRLFLYA